MANLKMERVTMVAASPAMDNATPRYVMTLRESSRTGSTVSSQSSNLVHTSYNNNNNNNNNNTIAFPSLLKFYFSCYRNLTTRMAKLVR